MGSASSPLLHVSGASLERLLACPFSLVGESVCSLHSCGGKPFEDLSTLLWSQLPPSSLPHTHTSASSYSAPTGKKWLSSYVGVRRRKHMGSCLNWELANALSRCSHPPLARSERGFCNAPSMEGRVAASSLASWKVQRTLSHSTSSARGLHKGYK